MKFVDKRKLTPLLFGDLCAGEWFVFKHVNRITPRLKLDADRFLAIVTENPRKSFLMNMPEIATYRTDEVERIDVTLIMETPK